MTRRATIAERILWRCRNLVLSRPSIDRPHKIEPVTVAGLFSTASGIGQSARACADALEDAGISVRRVDLSADFYQVDLPPPERLAADPAPGGTLIVHLNAPETERALFLLRNWRGSGRRVIGMWVWELPVTPIEWQPATRWLSEIWVPSRHTFEALRPLTRKPMQIVPYFVAPLPYTPIPSDDQVFTVLVLADGKSSFERKNILSALRAFEQARFSRPSRLIIKTRNLAQSAGLAAILKAASIQDPRVEILDGALTKDQIREMMAGSDVLMSLHRSEGFGLTLAEAMLLGKPVVATGWSGNTDFMDDNCSVLVPYRLVPVEDGSGIYSSRAGAVWAEPDVSFAASALERLASDPELRRRLGQAARARIEPMTRGTIYRRALERCSMVSVPGSEFLGIEESKISGLVDN